jgi:hypothetical protein
MRQGHNQSESTAAAGPAVVVPERIRTITDVTPAWLTVVLMADHPGVEVTSLRIDPYLGYKQNKARIHVTYNAAGEAAALPSSFIVKGNFPGAASDTTGAEFAMSAEAISYRDVVPLVGNPNTPKCLHIDVGSDAVVLLMEDLAVRKVSFLNAHTPLSYGQAARFVDAQARIHASLWNSDLFLRGKTLGPDSDAGRNAARVYNGYYPQILEAISWGRFAQLPRGSAVSRQFHDAGRITEAWKRMREVIQSCAQVIIHGDEHLGNLFIEQDGTPGFLDWFARPDGWVTAIAYFMVSCLDLIDRRMWERSLLSHYLTRLRAYEAQAPAFAEAWYAYRCASLYPLVVWLNNSGAWQPEAVNTACAARAGAACADHNVFKLLGC